jgi:putative hemolysin
MNLLLIVLLIVLNGVFAMSELALASSRKARLMAMQEGGDKGAAAALKLLGNPTQFLSVVQVGVTAITILNGIIGEAAFSAPVAGWLTALGLHRRAAEITATALVVAVITFLTIVFGELVPKRIGQLYPETVARWVAPPMRWLASVTKPIVALLALCTRAALKALRINDAKVHVVTEEEISASLAEGVHAGLIEAREQQMVQNVFHLDDRPLTSLMVPRDDIRWLRAGMNVAAAIDYAAAAGEHAIHSWYPVCQDNLDSVVGIISVSQLLQLRVSPEITLGAHVLPAVFVPETLSAMEMLEQLRAKAGRLLLVVDEYGVVQGLMTPRDLLEAITGELKPGANLDAWATALPEGGWLLDGLMPIHEMKARLQIKELPLEDKGRYNTAAGLALSVAGHLPSQGERIECAGWIFVVTAFDGRRIDKIAAFPAARPTPPAFGGENPADRGH